MNQGTTQLLKEQESITRTSELAYEHVS